MNDDGCETGVGDPVEGVRECVECEEHDDSGDDSCRWSTHAGLGLQRGAGEGAGRWVGIEEVADHVGDSDGN